MPPESSVKRELDSGLEPDWLQALVSVQTGPLVVAFHEPLAEHSRRLMDFLGVTAIVNEAVAGHCCSKSSGRVGRTRRNLTSQQRERLRTAYYARPDKRMLFRGEAEHARHAPRTRGT
jgi:hypothetical protein